MDKNKYCQDCKHLKRLPAYPTYCILRRREIILEMTFQKKNKVSRNEDYIENPKFKTPHDCPYLLERTICE